MERNKNTVYCSVHGRDNFESKLKNCKDCPTRTSIHRIKTLVDNGWPTLPDADANARRACENQRIGRCKSYFSRSLTPPGLKQEAHQALSEDPNKTWDAPPTLIFNKETSLVISGEMFGFEQSSSNSATTDSRFTNIEKTLIEISIMLKNRQINATYDPNNPKTKQDFTRFCTYCKKSSHTKKSVRH